MLPRPHRGRILLLLRGNLPSMVQALRGCGLPLLRVHEGRQLTHPKKDFMSFTR